MERLLRRQLSRRSFFKWMGVSAAAAAGAPYLLRAQAQEGAAVPSGEFIRLGRDQHHFGWDRTNEPVLSVAPGAEIEFETIDPSGGQLTRGSSAADVAALDFGRVNPTTGPVFVEGAEPGDALKIEVLGMVEGSGWGWTAIVPGFGLLADEFTEPYLHISDYDEQRVEFTPEIELAARPFPGTVGVVPAESGVHPVVPPRNVGGNMDMRDLIVGSTLYLPVEVEGGLLSVGDTHAAQGDGEVCGTAVETAYTVQLRVGLVKGAGIKRPQFEIPAAAHEEMPKGYFVTAGVAPDLMDASKDAIRDMIDHLGREYGLDPELAYTLCSAAVHLRISELVDAPNWVVSAYLPKHIFI